MTYNFYCDLLISFVKKEIEFYEQMPKHLLLTYSVQEHLLDLKMLLIHLENSKELGNSTTLTEMDNEVIASILNGLIQSFSEKADYYKPQTFLQNSTLNIVTILENMQSIFLDNLIKEMF